MIHWLAQAARARREEHGLMQVQIAAAMPKDQATIYRFEQGQRWPRDLDAILDAYAHELGISQLELWEDALARWRSIEG